MVLLLLLLNLLISGPNAGQNLQTLINMYQVGPMVHNGTLPEMHCCTVCCAHLTTLTVSCMSWSKVTSLQSLTFHPFGRGLKSCSMSLTAALSCTAATRSRTALLLSALFT